MQRELGEKVGFLALSVVPDVETTAAAAARTGIRARVAVANGPIMDPLGIREAPSVLFLTKDLRIAAVGHGFRGKRSMRARARELLE